MVFTTSLFVFYFLPLVLALYFSLLEACRRLGASDRACSLVLNAVLVCASYVFYGWWEPWFVLLMLGVTAINYLCARVASRPSVDPRRKARATRLAILASLGTLGFFKYAPFLEQNLNDLLSWFGVERAPVLALSLPIGISFYVFHALSYTIDIERRTAAPVRSGLDFACYIAFFPQLVAGPIIRYNTVAEQLVHRTVSAERFRSGIVLFVLGFAKKILLANPMGRVADAAFGAQSPGALDAWFGAVAFSIQIYFDFAGYSDMAIGLARMIGFEFPRNFNAPYQSQSITDFWRRWHISLSTFLRDYLYIPLGGNRRGPIRTYVNLLVVMLLGGLWHGANWTYVVWGAYHGVLLALERYHGKRGFWLGMPRGIRVCGTLVLVLVSWVFFRAASLHDALIYLAAMCGQSSAGPAWLALPSLLYTRTSLAVMAVAGVVLAWPVQAHDWSREITGSRAMLIHPLFCLALLVMISQSFNPFLYFQF